MIKETPNEMKIRGEKMTKKKRKVAATQSDNNTNNEIARTDIESRDLEE
jgi:hypothetical protein